MRRTAASPTRKRRHGPGGARAFPAPEGTRSHPSADGGCAGGHDHDARAPRACAIEREEDVSKPNTVIGPGLDTLKARGVASPRTWLITGSSRGLGRALGEVALAAGENVVATARDPDQLEDLVA